MAELDAMTRGFDEQRKTSRAAVDYKVSIDVHERATRLARLSPDPELRSLLVGGMEGVTAAWLLIPEPGRKATDIQRDIVNAMQEALSCYLTDEPLTPELHRRAWRAGELVNPEGARAALAKWVGSRRRLSAKALTR